MRRVVLGCMRCACADRQGCDDHAIMGGKTASTTVFDLTANQKKVMFGLFQKQKHASTEPYF